MTDPSACGLGTLGRPEGFVQRTIGEVGRNAAVTSLREPRVHEGDRNAARPGSGRQPFSGRPARLLHLDFKLDNLILDPATLEPRAIVNWDMGTRGDPLFDLGDPAVSYWPEARDPPELQGGVMMPISQPGFWTRRQAAVLVMQR